MPSTIVSLVPRLVEEFLPGVNPGVYRIPAAKNNIPEILIVTDAWFSKYMLDDHWDRIDMPSEMVAKDIVRMYSTSQVGYGPDAGPGIFVVPNKVLTKTSVLTECAEELEVAKKRQHNWFMNLIREADDLWARFHQHRMISDLNRDALKYLNMDREWRIADFEEMNTKPKCPACYSILPAKDVPVCGNCKSIINPKKYKELGFAQVEA